MRFLGFFDRGGVKVVGACVLSALLGFAAGNGHTTHGAVASLGDRLGQTTAWAKCEDWRSHKTERVARQAIKGALIEREPVPSAGEIPKDCQHPRFMRK